MITTRQRLKHIDPCNTKMRIFVCLGQIKTEKNAFIFPGNDFRSRFYNCATHE